MAGPTIVYFETTYGDEYEIRGFIAFRTETEAATYRDRLIELSDNDPEWYYFGSNEAIGCFTKNDFKFRSIDEFQFETLLNLFPYYDSRYKIAGFGIAVDMYELTMD